MSDAPETLAQYPVGRRLRQVPPGLLLICAVVWVGSLFGAPQHRPNGWLEAVLLLLAVAATQVSQGRALPWQNVLAATGVILVISAAANLINARTGIPFGLIAYPDTMGPQISGLLPWWAPFIWVVAIFNSRGVARLILRPWRKLSKYGYWLIALTCLLSVVFDFALEPFASGATTHWIWRTSPTTISWYSAPWSNFLGWLVTSLLILGFTTPWLISKKSSRHSTPDYQPLLLWLLLTLLPAIGCAAHQLWLATAFNLLAAVLVTFFAIRGARW